MNIELSERAQKALIDLGVGNDQYFRIKVVSGGCSGMTYSAAIDNEMTEEDMVVFDENNLKVIADFNSGKLSGALFLEKIREIPAHETTPFIFLLNSGDKAKAKQLMEESLCHSLIKPYTANSLYEKIQTILS